MFHVYWPALALVTLIVMMVIMVILMYGDKICNRVRTKIYSTNGTVPLQQRPMSRPRPAQPQQHHYRPPAPQQQPPQQYFEMERPPQQPQRMPHTYSHEIEV